MFVGGIESTKVIMILTCQKFLSFIKRLKGFITSMQGYYYTQFLFVCLYMACFYKMPHEKWADFISRITTTDFFLLCIYISLVVMYVLLAVRVCLSYVISVDGYGFFQSPLLQFLIPFNTSIVKEKKIF